MHPHYSPFFITQDTEIFQQKTNPLQVYQGKHGRHYVCERMTLFLKDT